MDRQERVRAHVWISGVVQGVGFRAAMRREATRLGLVGWVRNLRDGRVEAIVEGDAARVRALLAWCRKGPPRARVSGVHVAYEAPRGDLSGFRIVR